MAGNYGGASIPTTPITGSALVTGKGTTYKNYMCTTVLGTSASSTFTYKGVAVPVPQEGTIELIVSPPQLASQTDCIFFCYDCSCNSPMTGSTAPSSGMTNPSGPLWNPVILGGNGLNS